MLTILATGTDDEGRDGSYQEHTRRWNKVKITMNQTSPAKPCYRLWKQALKG